MTFMRSFLRRDKKKLFSAIMCVGFGLFFYIHGAIHGFTTSKIVFGTLLIYFGIRNFSLSKY